LPFWREGRQRLEGRFINWFDRLRRTGGRLKGRLSEYSECIGNSEWYGRCRYVWGQVKKWVAGQPPLRLIAGGLAVYLAVASLAYALFGPNACEVTVGGRPVAVAKSSKSARQALDGLLADKSAALQKPVKPASRVDFRPVRLGRDALRGEVLDTGGLKQVLGENLTFTVKCAVITVGGEPKVCLSSKGEAEELLSWLLGIYPAAGDERVEFKEKVEVAERYVPLDGVLSLEEAKKAVLLGSVKYVQYTVQEGDTLWDIALASGIDQEQIVLANPGMDPENLSIGQVLYLSKEAPMITVLATRQVTVEEEVPCPVEVRVCEELLPGERRVVKNGLPGKRVVTYRIVRENGLETAREVLEQRVLAEAVPEVVERGPALLASRGGVRLEWPCCGGVESYFGMRWGRMHEGIDIGAPYGCEVGAAAGGTVVFAGWDGGYGRAVEIAHGGGFSTKYAHLSAIYVSPGERVERGEIIGLVGSTGYSTGPHLHFEVRVNGQPRNPLNYLP